MYHPTGWEHHPVGTPRRKAWPVGQVVKTAASHAVNIGSNPVRVTIPKKRCFFGNRKLDNWIKVCYCMKAVAIQQLVLIRARVHPFPSRTRKLSSLLPTILGWRRPGKIGSANTKEVTHASGFSFYRFGGSDIVQAILFGWIRYIGSYFVTIR